jgi:hypothetical protein
MLIANYNSTRKGCINNKIHHYSYLYNATNRDIVKPSPDILYSYVFIDFNKINYIIFQLPECEVYRSLTLYDNDTNVVHVFNHHKLSKNTNNNLTYNVMVVSPNFKIQHNDTDMIIVRSPTNICLGIQRIFCSNKNKLNTLIDIQQKFIINEINNNDHLSLSLSLSLLKNIFAVIVIYLCVYSGILITKYVLACILIDFLVYYMNERIINIFSSKIGPWKFNTMIGCKDCNCFLKLYIAITSILALTKDEAIYMIACTDSSGNKLMPNEHYIIYFSNTLPAKWWSITAYGNDNYLIPNTKNIYSYNNEDIKNNFPFVIHLSNINNSYQNWLPSGTTNTQLVLRLYNSNLSNTFDVNHLPKILKI